MAEPTDSDFRTGERDAKGRFRSGHKGGPGRREGGRNKATMLLERLMADDAEAVVKATVEAAKGGDMQAAKLILDRVVPVRKGRPVSLDLPRIETAAEALRAQAAVAEAMAAGELSPEEATAAAGVFEAVRRAHESETIERRLAALEAQQRSGRR